MTCPEPTTHQLRCSYKEMGLTGKFEWLVPVERGVELASIFGQSTSVASRQLCSDFIGTYSHLLHTQAITVSCLQGTFVGLVLDSNLKLLC